MPSDFFEFLYRYPSLVSIHGRNIHASIVSPSMFAHKLLAAGQSDVFLILTCRSPIASLVILLQGTSLVIDVVVACTVFLGHTGSANLTIACPYDVELHEAL